MINDNEKEIMSADVQTENSECGGCCDCCGGECSLESKPAPKKKCPVVTPVIIAFVAFVLVAAIVFGTIEIYNAGFKVDNSIAGVWIEEGTEEAGIYFVFDNDGNVSMDGGGISYYGTYATDVCDLSSSDVPEVVKTIADSQKMEGTVNVLTSEFYIFGMCGSKLVYEFDRTDEKEVINFYYADNTGAVSNLNFIKSQLPEFSIDPQNITNASADEAGITALNTDKNIIGTWSEKDYGTYTFNADGTGKYRTDYQINQIYQLYYGVTLGYGVDIDFKYTTSDGKIYMTIDYFTGQGQDDVMTYMRDGNNLVINGVGYAKSK